MSRSVYEGMFLLDNSKTSGDWDKASKLVHGILERHEADVLASRPWDERTLVFPVKGHKRGMYLLTYFRAEGSRISLIEHDCRINEAILRQLILRVEPKLVDQLLSQAMTPRDAAAAEEQLRDTAASGERSAEKIAETVSE